MLTLPLWIVEGLLFWLEPLAAEEAQSAAVTHALPWMKETERRRITRAWQKAIRRAIPEQPATTIVEENPEKAREWFERLGAKIR